MTVEIQTNYVIHSGNGVATQFPYTFRIPEISMVVVSLLDATTNDVVRVLTYGVDFNITGVSQDNYDGGEVEYPLTGSPMPATNKLLILRTVPLTQGLDLENQGGFYPESVEYQLDKLEFQIQQLNTNVSQTMQFPLGIPPIDPQALIDAADDAEGAAERAEAAAASVAVKYAADDAALKALAGENAKAAFNRANEGWWLPTSDDISAEIAAGDPRYLPISGDATGASGGWYRAGSIATGQKQETTGARYFRLADMIRAGGEAIKHNGQLGSGGKGGFLWDKPLNFDGKTSDFTVGATLTSSSGGTAVISSITDLGTGAGTLWVSAVSGTFADNDTITDGSGGSATANGPVATNPLAWIEAQTIIAASGKYETGPVGLAGAIEGPGLGVVAAVRHSRSANLASPTSAWAEYVDATRYIPLGTTWGNETNICNALVSPATGPYNAAGHKAAATGGAGTTFGQTIMSGADPTVNPVAYTADVALSIGTNGAKFWTGIAILGAAIQRDGGATGRGHAMSLDYDNALEWVEFTTGLTGFSVVSQITDSAHKQELRASNAGVSLLDANGTTLVRLGWVANAANGLAISASATGTSASISATGSDTNIGIQMIPKGTGLVVSTTGFSASSSYTVLGTPVVRARKTGWATATGTATRTTFDTASITLPELAERVKALIDDLHATAGHGLIGA